MIPLRFHLYEIPKVLKLIEAENVNSGCQKLEDEGLRNCYSKGMKFHLCQITS